MTFYLVVVFFVKCSKLKTRRLDKREEKFWKTIEYLVLVCQRLSISGYLEYFIQIICIYSFCEQSWNKTIVVSLSESDEIYFDIC